MDPFSAAASAISVISLTFQLADNVNKLHDFWSSIRDAPQDVREIADDLKCLASLLKEIANGPNHSPSTVAGLESCEHKIKALFNIVRQLEPNFHSSNRRTRIWNSVRATLKKNRLKECRDSLQEAKTTLILTLIPRCHINPGYIGMHSSSESQRMIKALPSDKGGEVNIKSEFSQIASEMSIPDIQASMENALQEATQSAAKDLFGSGTFGQIMNDTGMRVATMQSTYHSSYDAVNLAPAEKDRIIDDNGVNLKRVQGRKATVCHRTSATGTLFGKVWVRTTTVKAKPRKGMSKGTIEIVTSFIFYPSWWLTKIGLRHGMEANLSNSSDGWKFNFSPVRAVPDNSLIFDFCHHGNLPAVKQLIARGDASVRDTSSKGWSPLHFAAEAANVELCEFLISAGADKTALVYEGPSEDTLSPVTIFAETAQKIPAERKIRMLRLFKDCLDLSEPNSEGWITIGRLVQSYNKEDVSVLSNSVNWVLQCVPADGMVGLGHATVWHGLQHAIRSLLIHEHQNRMVLSLLGLDISSEEPTSLSRLDSIAHWLALRVCERDLLPMQREAAAFLRINGYDFLKNPRVPPAEFGRTLPLLYNAWIKALPSTIKNENELIALEYEALLKEIGRNRDSLIESLRTTKKTDATGDRVNDLCCSACSDDYSSLGIGLVDPLWLAFVECTSSKHRHNCGCSSFVPKPQLKMRSPSPLRDDCEANNTAFRVPGDINLVDESLNKFESTTTLRVEESSERLDEPPPYQLKEPEILTQCNQTPCHKTEIESDYGDNEEISSVESSWIAECELLVQSRTSSKNPDPFEVMVTILYRSLGRNLLGAYRPGERLCGTCFLKREGFISKDGMDGEDQYVPHPDTWFVEGSDEEY